MFVVFGIEMFIVFGDRMFIALGTGLLVNGAAFIGLPRRLS
jgi:hypothetical protein